MDLPRERDGLIKQINDLAQEAFRLRGALGDLVDALVSERSVGAPGEGRSVADALVSAWSALGRDGRPPARSRARREPAG